LDRADVAEQEEEGVLHQINGSTPVRSGDDVDDTVLVLSD